MRAARVCRGRALAVPPCAHETRSTGGQRQIARAADTGRAACAAMHAPAIQLSFFRAGIMFGVEPAASDVEQRGHHHPVRLAASIR